MKTSDKWIHTLLAHFKQQYANTRKQLEKQHRLTRASSHGSHLDKVRQEDKGLREEKSPREGKGKGAYMYAGSLYS